MRAFEGRLTAAAPDGGRATFELIRGNDERPPRVSRKRSADKNDREFTKSRDAGWVERNE